MLKEEYFDLQELISYSSILHKTQINSTINYLKGEKSDYERWCELIYSILVGSQIKTGRAKLCYEKLLDKYFDLLNPIFLIDSRYNL